MFKTRGGGDKGRLKKQTIWSGGSPLSKLVVHESLEKKTIGESSELTDFISICLFDFLPICLSFMDLLGRAAS